MAREKSAIVSGAGFAASFWIALDKAARKRGLDDEQIYDLLNGENSSLVDKIADLMADSVRPKLLELVAMTTIPATTERFVAKERFVLGTGSDAAVKISYLGDNFKKWFLNKVEEPFAGSTIQFFKLRQSSVDGPIIAELGGEAKAETTLAEIRSLMERHKNGEQGILLTNGWANIFYVRDVAGVLRAVSVNWSDDGWCVCALSALCRWSADYRVFSRNS